MGANQLVPVGEAIVTDYLAPTHAYGTSMDVETVGLMVAQDGLVYRWAFFNGMPRMLIVVDGERVL